MDNLGPGRKEVQPRLPARHRGGLIGGIPLPNFVPTWPPPVYRILVDFNAPLPYVFRWCTDYRSDDAVRARESYDRRILRRTRNEVLFEDLWWERDGWRWRRTQVRLHPPDRWHADSIGNIRDASIDYRLTELPEGRTRLELRMRRRPAVGRPGQPARGPFEKELRQLWSHFRRAMMRDYRRVRANTRRSRPKGSPGRPRPPKSR